MNGRNRRVFAMGCALVVVMAGCASGPKKDYSAFRRSDPASVLVVPVVNATTNVDAPDYFLCTVSVPLAERGYYVFPVNAVKRLMEDEGLSDADMVHSADPIQLASLFGADSVLYISIERWDAQYIVISTTVTVSFSYRLVDGHTGQLLWTDAETMQYSSNSTSSGNLLADLVGGAVSAALTKAAPNYIPLAKEANETSVTAKGTGLPAGPYHEAYGKDSKQFPSIGN